MKGSFFCYEARDVFIYLETCSKTTDTAVKREWKLAVGVIVTCVIVDGFNSIAQDIIYSDGVPIFWRAPLPAKSFDLSENWFAGTKWTNPDYFGSFWKIRIIDTAWFPFCWRSLGRILLQKLQSILMYLMCFAKCQLMSKSPNFPISDAQDDG